MSEKDRLPPEVYECAYFEWKRLAIDLGYPDHCKISYSAWMAAEIELLRKQLFAAQQAILREGMEVNRLREENKALRMCPGAVEYSVAEPSGVRR